MQISRYIQMNRKKLFFYGLKMNLISIGKVNLAHWRYALIYYFIYSMQMSLTPTIYCLDSNVVRPLYLLLEKKYPKSFIGFEDFVDKNLSNDMEQNELYVHKNAGILKLLKKRHFFSENSLVLLHWLKVIKPLKHLWIVLRSTLYILFKTIQMCSRLQYTHMRFLWKKVGAPQQSSTLCIPKKAKERTASKPS